MIDFNALQQPNVFGTFQAGLQLGQEQKRQRVTQNALAAYAQNPDDQNAISQLMAVDPRLGMQVREQQASRATAAHEQQRANLSDVARLLDGATDEASYQRGLRVAKSLGLDVGSAPPSYDPAWVEDQKFLVQSFLAEPEKTTTFLKEAAALGISPEEAKTIWKNKHAPPMQAIDVTNADGSVSRYFYPQGALPGSALPSGGIQPPPQAIQYLRQNPALREQFDAKYGAGAADQALGGAPSQGGASFP